MRPLVVLIVTLVTSAAVAGPISVVTTTSTLAAIVRTIGGRDVELGVFVRPDQDPHEIDLRAEFRPALDAADLLVLHGGGYEDRWLGTLLRTTANRDVQAGGTKHLAVADLLPAAMRQASEDDAHALLDPVVGLRVAAAIRTALGRERPTRADAFASAHDAFAERLVTALVGRAVTERHGIEVVRGHLLRGRVRKLVGDDPGVLGGWLGRMRPHRGARLVVDHDAWTPLARRFGLAVAASFEPKPGHPPTDGRLLEVVRQMRNDDLGVILSVPFTDPAHAALVGRGTGATVLAMAHAVGARPGTRDYVTMIGFNVRQLDAALKKRGR